MRAEETRVGIKVRVREDHRNEGRRGQVGRIVGRYGRHENVALDVRFPDGQHELFWPGDLEEVTAPRSWWHTLLSRG